MKKGIFLFFLLVLSQGCKKFAVIESEVEPFMYIFDGGIDSIKLEIPVIIPKDYKYGDFDGDGLCDLIKSEDDKWFVILGKNMLNSNVDWELWKLTTVNIRDARFEDINLDGKTDAIITDDGWKISYEAKNDWELLLATNFLVEDACFGDFDGNGKLDALIPMSGSWLVNYDSNSTWDTLMNSNYVLNEMALGDFNKDGQTDVITNDSLGFWQISLSGNSDWESWGVSKVKPHLAQFDDFDGDGATDVVYRSDSLKSMGFSKSATEPWTLLFDTEKGIEDFGYGDFNGNGTVDILVKK